MEYLFLELNAKLGKIKLNRKLKLPSVGALTLVGSSNFILMINAPIEERLVESGFFFLGAFAFGLSAIKENNKANILKKQINKLHNK